MRISIIVAMDGNGIIGKDGQIPWQGKLPADMKYFRKTTTGHPVIMGRRTYESLPKPLRDRTNIVLTRSMLGIDKGFIKANSVDQALRIAASSPGNEEVFVMGGQSIYMQFLLQAERIYATYIHFSFLGDTSFPKKIDEREWDEISSNFHRADGTNHYDYCFKVFDRRSDKTKFVNPKFAKRDTEYAAVIDKIIKEGHCPFCEEHFIYHDKPILRQRNGWMLTENNWPYDDTQHHMLIVNPGVHKESFDDLSPDDIRTIFNLAQWAIKEYGIPGGLLALRFGDTDITGATVTHIHAHIVVPKEGKTVHFPIG